MANPYNDVRAITARLGQVRPAGITPGGSLNPTSPTRSTESIQLGRAANKFAIQNPQLRAEIERIASGSGSSKPTGVVGNVLGNPVTKVALKGLEAFTLPGRAVVAASREMVDAFDKNDKTKASLSDFSKNVKDSTYGFGKAFKIDTGNIWLDRAIGFAGDIALDPLTYATFGASAGLQGGVKGAGYANRMNLANRVLANTGDAALARSVSISGRSALRNSPEVLERVGANKFGVYFFGKRVKVGKNGMGWRVPLSGTIGEIGEATLAKARLGITNTRMGKYMQKMTMPKDALNLRLAVSRGELGADETAQALRLFDAIPKQRLARATAQQTIEQQLMAILKAEEPNIESYRGNLYALIEDPAKLAVASEAEKRAVNVWKAHLDAQWENVAGRWQQVDEAAELGKTENYFPRVRSDKAEQFLNSQSPHAVDVRSIYMDDPFALPGAFTPRSLRPGKKWFGYVLKDGDMSIDRLNQIAREQGGIDFDFFETDIVNVMRKYASDTADEIGVIERNAALKEAGFFEKIDEMRVRDLEIDEDAVAAARSRLDEQVNLLDGVEQDLRKGVIDLVDTVRAESLRVKQGLATAERLKEDMSRYLYELMNDIALKSEAVRYARANLASLFGPEGSISLYSLSDDFPVMMRPMLSEFDDMSATLGEYAAIVQELHEQSMKAGYDAFAADDALRQIEDAAKAAHESYKQAQESVKSISEIANAIEANWEAIVGGGVGGRVQGTAAQRVVAQFREILGMRGADSTKKAQKARAKALQVEGALKSFLRGQVEAGTKEAKAYDFYMSMWDEVAGSGQSGLKPSVVSEMTEDKFFSIILNAASKDVNMVDLRAASLYALGRDIRLYQAESIDDLPKFVQRFHTELKEMLSEASWDEAGRVARSNATKSFDDEIDAINARWGSLYDEATYMRDTLGDYSDVIRFIEDDIAKQLGDGWEGLPFDESIAPALEEAVGGARLPFLYDDYIDGAEDLFGRQANLGDVVQHMKERHEAMRGAYEDVPINIDADAAKKLENLVQNREEQIKLLGEEYAKDEEFLTDFVREKARIKRNSQMTREQLIVKYEAEISAAKSRRNAASRPEFEFRPSEARKARASDTTKDTLARTMIEYQAVSDAVQKFEAISAVLAPHGMVATEDMWRGILRTTAHTYGDQYADKVTRLIAAEEKFTEFYANFTKKLQEMKRLPEEEQIHISRLFKESLETLMNGEDADIMRELFGPTMSRLVDKGDMFADVRSLQSAVRNSEGAAKEAAKARLDRYVDTYVIPWAKELDPTIRADKGPALNLLKNSVAGEGGGLRTASKAVLAEIRTPLSREASEQDIYRWFNSMLDTIDPANGNVVVKGNIARTRESYRTSQMFFARMKDGYLDVQEFFKTLDGSRHTPSSYALQMIELANKLDGATILSDEVLGVVNPLVRGEVLETVGTNYKKAAKGGQKAADKARAEANKAAQAAQRAREVAEAFNNPNLTIQELKALGFTKEMVESYEAVSKLKRLESSGDYAKAVHDKEMVDFLDSVSGVNFALFDEGIVIGTTKAEQGVADQFAGDISASVKAEVDRVQNQLDTLAIEEAKEIARITEPFVVRRDGKVFYKSKESKKIAQQRVEIWKSREGSRYRAERLRLEDRMATAEERILASVNPSLATEDVPVFAKMPDGTNITFTQDEWDSLFIPPYGDKDLNLFVDEIRTAQKEQKILQGELDDMLRGKVQGYQKPRINRIQQRIDTLEIEIKQAQTEFNRSMPNVRNAALEKVRILVKQIQESAPQDNVSHWMKEWEDVVDQISSGRYVDNIETRNITSEGQVVGKYEAVADATGRGWMDSFVYKDSQVNRTVAYYFDKTRKANSTVYTAPPQWSVVRNGSQTRRNSLQAMWRSNTSHAVLQEREELAQIVAMTQYKKITQEATMLERTAAKAHRAAERTQMVATDVQTSFKKAIVEMRNAELQAARSAGAEFDTATPFWSTNKEVKYVLNGKEYVVPSVNEMLADPAKYIKRSRQRGDLFFDMKKPGNVVMWDQASEEVRASMALFGLQNVLLNDSARMFEAGVVNPSFARANEAYEIMTRWSKDAETLAEKIKSVREAIEAEKIYAAKVLKDSEEALYKTQMDVFEFGAELRASFNYYNPLVTFDENGLMQMESMISALRKRNQILEQLAEDMPKKADAAALNSAKKPATRAKWLKLHQDWINDNRELLRGLAMAELADGNEAKVWDAMLKASVAETRFMLHEGRVQSARSALDTAQAGVYVDRVLAPATQQFNDAVDAMLQAQGRTVASDFNMPSYSVNSQVNDLMSNIKRINDGAVLRELGSFMSSYTGFFKAYATLSPGFHVRNSISNTFQLFAAGAEVKNMRAGLKLWRSLGEHVKNGGNLESWLASGAVPKGMEAQARIAGEVTLALGGGKTEDAFAEFITNGASVIKDNVATRASRRFGHRVEGSARFMLAFDSAQKGMDFNSAFTNTGRFLVDYNNPTLLDESVRNILPFWTWMSRNLPVQIVTQWTNPKPYVVYQRFANNFMVQDDEQLPEYMRNKNPIQIGKGTFLTPDLPFMAAEETINLANNPRKALSMVNPGLRVPLELAAGKTFFTGREFGNEPGQQSAMSYSAQNLLPMLGQIDRVTDMSAGSDQLGLARYLGIPIRGMTDEKRNSELQRRLYELSAYVNENGGR
jgi:hypothetical protein